MNYIGYVKTCCMLLNSSVEVYHLFASAYVGSNVLARFSVAQHLNELQVQFVLPMPFAPARNGG
jgi:hypothetical protein